MARDARSAVVGRESAFTRNPHQPAAPAKQVQCLQKLPQEERVLEQWRAACGCPISDEAKAQFSIAVRGRNSQLADVRLWQEHHPLGSKQKDISLMFLEFFFDGSPSEIEGCEDEFSRAFERMLEEQLQEQRIVEFRSKLMTRRRNGLAGDDGVAADLFRDDASWGEYLRRPVPPANLSVRAFREAGCMLRFLVIQTSLSVGASESLGQMAFQEHFPIDGVVHLPATSLKALPRWVNWMVAATFALMLLTVVAWWQVLVQATHPLLP